MILPQKDGFIYGTAEPTVSGLWFKSDGADVPADQDVGNGLFYYRDNDGQLHPMYPMTRMDAVYGLPGKFDDLEKQFSDRLDAMHKPITVTLSAGGWQDGYQTVNAPGVTAEDTVIVSPEPGDGFDEYAQCGVRCASQASGSLTFRCRDVPDRALTVNVQVWRAAE